MNKKQWLGLGLVAVAAVGLAACGNRSSRKAASSSDVKTKAAIVTDTGGVDDKSFNQSAWEGLQAWGKEMVFLKITDLLTSNLQVKQILRITSAKLLQTATN
mgnify:CR=1 FL=1